MTAVSGDRWAYALSVVAFALAVVIRVATFGDYGTSWDEHLRVRSGEAKSLYLREVAAGDRAFGELTPALEVDVYPGLFDISNWELSLALRADPFVTLHAWVQIWGLSALVAVWLIGWRLSGPWAGLAALLFLATAPRFWGHGAFNPKDVPFLTAYAWSLWWLLEAARPLPRLAPWRWLLAAVSAGLCAAIRVAGLVFVGYGFLVLAASLGWSLWQGRVGEEAEADVPAGGIFRALVTHAAVGGGFAVVAVLVLWPFFPPLHLHLGSLFEAAAGPPWKGEVLFEGALHKATALPAYYLPKWLLIALPEGLLLALALCPFAAWLWWRRSDLDAPAKARRFMPLALIVVTMLVPILYSVLSSRSQYDGLRHSLFLHVPLACLAALGLTAAVRLSLAGLARGLVAAACLSFVWNAYHLVTLHPYQYVYFNGSVGYLPGADGRFEKDYWGLSLKEAVAGLEAELAGVADPPPIASMRPHFLARSYLTSSGLQHVAKGASSNEASYLVVLDRWDQAAEATSFGGSIARLAVTRQGVELCRIHRRGSRRARLPTISEVGPDAPVATRARNVGSARRSQTMRSR